MIKIENVVTPSSEQWKAVIMGARNPLNSWNRSDTIICEHELEDWPHDAIKTFNGLGPNDHDLLMRLCNAGTDHRKFMRMITVHLDMTAPLYFWKEFDTYKIGTVANSCSTMHKIHSKEFMIEDFSIEHLDDDCMSCEVNGGDHFYPLSSLDVLKITIDALNYWRRRYLATKNKEDWWQMIQLLPTSYNQKRTVMLNYEVLANIYKSRKDHKLDCWHTFCDWIKSLPYSELITGQSIEEKD